MDFERRSIALVDLDQQEAGEGLRLYCPATGKGINLTATESKIFALIERGLTVHEIIQELRSWPQLGRLNRFYHLLVKLCRHNFVRDAGVQKYVAETLGTWQWPKSLIDFSIFELFLFTTKVRRVFHANNLTIVLLTAILFAVASLTLLSQLSLLRDFPILNAKDARWFWFGGPVIFTVAKNIEAILKLNFDPRMVRAEVHSHLVVSPLAIYANAVRATPANPHLRGSLFTPLFVLLLAPTLSYMVLVVVEQGHESFYGILFWLGALWLHSFDPFTENSFTEVLKVVYSRTFSQENSERRELVLNRLFMIYSAFWVGVFFIFVAGIVYPLLLSVTGGGLHQVLAFVFILFFVLGKIYDIAVSFEVDANLFQLRRRWLLNSGAQSHVAGIMADESKSFTQRFLQLPFIRNMPTEIQGRIIKSAQKRLIPKGTVLVRQGEPSRDLFVISEGEVGVYTYSPMARKTQLVTTLKPGAVFGESGFFLNKKRSASLIVLEDSKIVIIRYDESYMKGALDEHRQSEFQKRLWYLQVLVNSPFFAGLSSESLDQFVGLGTIEEIPRDVTVMQEGGAAESLYIVIQGEVGVEQGGVEIASLGPGEIVGEIGVLVPDGRRTAKVITKADTLFCIVHQDLLWDFFADNFLLALNVERTAVARAKVAAE